jgi:hypothetical protein
MSNVTRRAVTAAALMVVASASSSAYASSVVRPNPDEQSLVAQALSRASGAGGGATVRPNPDEQSVGATTGGVDGGAGIVRRVVRPVAKPGGGFHWGDAGIGAAAAVGFATLGVAGGLSLSQRRARRPGRSTAHTS